MPTDTYFLLFDHPGHESTLACLVPSLARTPPIRWYLVTFLCAWFAALINVVIVVYVVCRTSIPMRHDTISSFIAGHSDASRALVTSLTMTTMAVLGCHLLEWEHRRICHDTTYWASALCIVGSIGPSV